jgi:hypothetical protein
MSGFDEKRNSTLHHFRMTREKRAVNGMFTSNTIMATQLPPGTRMLLQNEDPWLHW